MLLIEIMFEGKLLLQTAFCERGEVLLHNHKCPFSQRVRVARGLPVTSKGRSWLVA